ncbi:hypothetical protein [Paenibacillus sp. GCM10027626]|uniref:hypothetical protein n=1 Tax=Paenibacillus sp. GCM10027626 TaxID=3273411 RepID=UPI003634C053
MVVTGCEQTILAASATGRVEADRSVDPLSVNKTAKMAGSLKSLRKPGKIRK